MQQAEDGSYVIPGGDYMEQEDEWEREGLLDPAWEKQQKKVSKVSRSATPSVLPRLPKSRPAKIRLRNPTCQLPPPVSIVSASDVWTSQIVLVRCGENRFIVTLAQA